MPVVGKGKSMRPSGPRQEGPRGPQGCTCLEPTSFWSTLGTQDPRISCPNGPKPATLALFPRDGVQRPRDVNKAGTHGLTCPHVKYLRWNMEPE